MSVDANVLINERIREELRSGRHALTAVLVTHGGVLRVAERYHRGEGPDGMPWQEIPNCGVWEATWPGTPGARGQVGSGG